MERPLHSVLLFPLQSALRLASGEVCLLSRSGAPGGGCEVSVLSRGITAALGSRGKEITQHLPEPRTVLLKRSRGTQAHSSREKWRFACSYGSRKVNQCVLGKHYSFFTEAKAPKTAVGRSSPTPSLSVAEFCCRVVQEIKSKCG